MGRQLQTAVLDPETLDRSYPARYQSPDRNPTRVLEVLIRLLAVVNQRAMNRPLLDPVADPMILFGGLAPGSRQPWNLVGQ